MNLEKHINTLLYSHDCVIVPGFGAFLGHKNSSYIKDNSVYPPSKKIGFNSSLNKSDGLLIQTYSQANFLTFEEAQREIDTQISFWKNHLEKNSTLILNELGTFHKNSSGKLEFTPNDINYMLESFGLESLRTKLIMQTATKANESNGVWWKVASIVPILVGGYLYFAQPQPVANFVNEQWSGFIVPLIDKEAKAGTVVVKPQAEPEVVKIETETVEVTVVENLIHDYQVIAGSFRVQSEAETLESKLKEEGFENARFTQKKGSYYYVAFQTFPTKEEALEFRRSLEEQYPEAWVLSLKD